jgi:predicted nucleic acid-binding protein
LTAFAVDSNILVYAMGSGDPRNEVARDLMIRALAVNPIIPCQAFGELFNVCRMKRIAAVHRVRSWMADVLPIIRCPQTTPADVGRAALLADRAGIQFFDALILQVARTAGATVLLSEDMADGESYDGVRVLNPFNPANSAEIDALLTASW